MALALREWVLFVGVERVLLLLMIIGNAATPHATMGTLGPGLNDLRRTAWLAGTPLRNRNEAAVHDLHGEHPSARFR